MGAQTKVTLALVILAGNLANVSSTAAQDFPSRNITLIIPVSAGGGLDALGRVFGQRLAAGFGSTVIVDNRPGANSVIGAEVVARAHRTDTPCCLAMAFLPRVRRFHPNPPLTSSAILHLFH